MPACRPDTRRTRRPARNGGRSCSRRLVGSSTRPVRVGVQGKHALRACILTTRHLGGTYQQALLCCSRCTHALHGLLNVIKPHSRSDFAYLFWRHDCSSEIHSFPLSLSTVLRCGATAAGTKQYDRHSPLRRSRGGAPRRASPALPAVPASRRLHLGRTTRLRWRRRPTGRCRTWGEAGSREGPCARRAWSTMVADTGVIEYVRQGHETHKDITMCFISGRHDSLVRRWQCDGHFGGGTPSSCIS